MIRWIAAFAALSMAAFTFAQGQAPATQPMTDRAALERQLEQTLTNATLVGRFTVDGNNGQPKEDRYSLGLVQKKNGDWWLITAKIGNREGTLPLMLPIQWAGDTPVITVTNFGVPGMGSYTARVVIYGDHYAGFWSAGPTHQGTMFGRIEHAPATQPAGETK